MLVDNLRLPQTNTEFDRRKQVRDTLRVTKDDVGRAWAEGLVRRVGAAIKKARGNKSAKWLSDRTADLGYRISPTVIAKLDSGHRGEVLSVAELFILAAALNIPPSLLLFPDYPDGTVELLPGYDAWVPKATEWLTGSAPLPVQILDENTFGATPESNNGVALVSAHARLGFLEQEIMMTTYLASHEASSTRERQADAARRLADLETKRAAIASEIAQLRSAIWGDDA